MNKEEDDKDTHVASGDGDDVIMCTRTDVKAIGYTIKSRVEDQRILMFLFLARPNQYVYY